MTTPTPHDDLVAHEPEHCVCGPLHIPVVRGDGVRSQIEIHRRLDGRENEPAEEWRP
jgi:hypothetical protein